MKLQNKDHWLTRIDLEKLNLHHQEE